MENLGISIASTEASAIFFDAGQEERARKLAAGAASIALVPLDGAMKAPSGLNKVMKMKSDHFPGVK